MGKMSNNKNVSPTILLIFGATGDLAKRKLFPAFYNLFLEGRMPKQFQIIALGRRDNDSEKFRDYIKDNLNEFSRNKVDSDEVWEKFSQQVTYFKHQLDEEESYKDLEKELKNIDEKFGVRANRLFYFSIAPSFISTVSEYIKKTELAPNADQDRIIIEKPFGHDKASAIELNELLTKTFKEEQIYRIDHYLGKETVQNIFTFRFGNSIFEPLWNHNFIEKVEITVAEEVGVEERGAFYEKTGALKDMIQNHLLQILCMVAMENPNSFEAKEIRDKKVDVLRAIRRIKPEDVSKYAVRGQYKEGEIRGKEVVAYREEKDVDKESNIETFAAIEYYLDNERWQNVPFYLRTGKRMKEKQSYVSILFKSIPSNNFPGTENMLANRLIINIQPTMDIRLQFMTKKPGLSMVLKPGEMVFDYNDCSSADSPEAYETLLLDALLGDPTLFMRSDQVEEAWDVVASIQDVWENETAPDFPNYVAGSLGPEASDLLQTKQGYKWLPNTIEKRK